MSTDDLLDELELVTQPARTEGTDDETVTVTVTLPNSVTITVEPFTVSV